MIAATKWDAFCGRDAEEQRLAGSALRALAHAHSAHLAVLGGLHPGGGASAEGVRAARRGCCDVGVATPAAPAAPPLRRRQHAKRAHGARPRAPPAQARAQALRRQALQRASRRRRWTASRGSCTTSRSRGSPSGCELRPAWAACRRARA